MPIFIQSISIHQKIKKNIEKFTQELNEKNIIVLFYKKFFDIKLSNQEIEVAGQEFQKLSQGISICSRYVYKTYLIDFAIASYVLDKFSFKGLLKIQNERDLYLALFRDYINLLKGDKTIEAILRDYIRCIHLKHYKPLLSESYLKTEISFLWTYFFSYSSPTQQMLKDIKNILVKNTSGIITFSFYSQLSRLNFNLYNQIITESELKQFEDDLLSRQDDFSSYVNRCFNISVLYSKSNPEKAKYYFEKGIIEGILRHGWTKDTIVSHQLVDALEILWKNNWGTKKKLEEYSKEVFELTLTVSNITDGRGTWQGPYNVVALVAKNDLKLAEEFKKKLIKEKGRGNFTNRVITDILKAKINLGFSIADIENEMHEYRMDYDYEGKPEIDYDKQKSIVYLEISRNDLYTDKEKKYAVEKYNMLLNSVSDENENNDTFLSREEKEFIKKVQNCSTKKQLAAQCKILNNNGIFISKYESWKILVEKIFDITENLKCFTDYLIKNYFPHMNFATSNSKYFHFGVAAALKNINSRQEMLNYLFEHSGHGGFTNIMKAYEVLEDKDMCIRLFDRYLKFCKLIVN